MKEGSTSKGRGTRTEVRSGPDQAVLLACFSARVGGSGRIQQGKRTIQKKGNDCERVFGVPKNNGRVGEKQDRGKTLRRIKRLHRGEVFVTSQGIYWEHDLIVYDFAAGFGQARGKKTRGSRRLYRLKRGACVSLQQVRHTSKRPVRSTL